MNAEDQESRIERLFQSAKDLPETEQCEFLAEQCQSDVALRSAVESLLFADRQARSQSTSDQPVGILQAHGAAEFVGEYVNGQQIGPYKITRRIGGGGFGEVFQAIRTEGFAQKVAIKIIRRDHQNNESLLARFEMERQVLADLDHENIARLIDGGQTPDGLPFLVMEYVPGKPITRYCDECRLGIHARLRLFQKVCDAVAAAHRLGIIHRDLKPSNILVANDGTPKLVDFGIAKLTDDRSRRQLPTITVAGMIPMTPEYASPEHVTGSPVTTATDVYSLGAILYELLVGVAPNKVNTGNLSELINTIVHAEPHKPSSTLIAPPFPVSRTGAAEEEVDANLLELTAANRSTKPRDLQRTLAGDLDMIVLKALRKEPSQRYHTPEELSDDIQRYFDGLPVSARKGSLRYRFNKFVVRNKYALAASAIVIVALIAGLITTSLSLAQTRRAMLQHQQQLYVSDMALACESMHAGRLDELNEILDRHIPVNGQPDLRGAEWHLLKNKSSVQAGKSLGKHDGRASELANVPKKRWVVSVGEDATLRIWDLQSHQEIVQFSNRDGPLFAVAVSHDGRYVAAGNRQISIWEIESQAVVRTLGPFDATIESLSFAPGDKSLAVGTRYATTYIVNVTDGTTICKSDNRSRQDNLLFSESGQHLFVSEKDEDVEFLQLCDSRTLRVEREYRRAGGMKTMALANNGKWLAVSSLYNPVISIIHVDAGALLFTGMAIGDGVRCLDFSADDSLLAVGHSSGTIRVWKVTSVGRQPHDETGNPELLMLTGPLLYNAGSDVSSIKFTGEQQFTSCAADGSVHLWTIPTAFHFAELGPLEEQLFRIAASPIDGRVVCTSDQRAWISDTAVQNWTELELQNDKTGDVAFSPDGKLLAVSTTQGVHVLDADTHASTLVFTDESSPGACEFSADSSTLAVSYYSGKQVALLDLQDGSLMRRIRQPHRMTCVAFARDGRVAFGGESNQLLLCDPTNAADDRVLDVGANVSCLAWNKDATILATGHSDGAIRLWDGTTFSQLGQLTGHTSIVNRLLFHTNERTLLSCSADSTVRFWNVPTRRSAGVLFRRPSLPHQFADRLWTPTDLALNRSGDRLFASFVGTSSDRNLLMWSVRSLESPDPR